MFERKECLCENAKCLQLIGDKNIKYIIWMGKDEDGMATLRVVTVNRKRAILSRMINHIRDLKELYKEYKK